MSQEKQEGEFSLKGKKTKPKNLGKTQDGPIKVDLSKSDKEPEVTRVVIDTEDNQVEEVVKKVVEEEIEQEQEVVQEDTPIIQEVTDETVQDEVEVLEEQLEQAVVEQSAGIDLPENIEKLVSFMKETGGTINDYVRLNADYSNIDNNTLLKEYYKKTKPYLDSEDVSLLLEDFSYDEDLDEERDIRKKKLAFKEEVAKAKNFLEQTKSKYYDEIKLRPGVTQEQKKATDFFNRYNEEQGRAEQQHEAFKSQTKKLFSQDFKGFDFNLGEKKFRYGVKDPSKVAESQSNINNIVGKFLDNEGNVKDPVGYHKAMYAAANVDTIANHFYEQGKADAVKQVIDGSKNPSQAVRQAPQTSFKDGIKVKVLGESNLSSSKLKIKKIKI
jgi:hypothetical protein